MTTITKNRNEIRFIREDGKYWYIDLNDGNMYGFSGKVVTRTPNGGKSAIKDYISYNDDVIAAVLEVRNNTNSVKYVQFIEKVMNLGIINAKAYNTYNVYSDACRYARAEYSDAQLLRALTAMVDEYNSKEHSRWSRFRWTFNDIITYIRNNEFAAKYAALVEQYGGTEVKTYYSRLVDYSICDTTPKWLERALKWSIDPQMRELVEGHIVTSYKATDMITDIFDWCSQMDVSLPKGRLIDEYILLRKNYTAWKNKSKEAAFQKAQEKVTAFENDDFVALVPTTIEELVQEGNAQRNCLGGYWLENYGNSAARFSRGVVLIRRKSNPEKPYITCDFMVGTGEIRQYLAYANAGVTDTDALNFKAELQKHLRACFA